MPPRGRSKIQSPHEPKAHYFLPPSGLWEDWLDLSVQSTRDIKSKDIYMKCLLLITNITRLAVYPWIEKRETGDVSVPRSISGTISPSRKKHTGFLNAEKQRCQGERKLAEFTVLLLRPITETAHVSACQLTALRARFWTSSPGKPQALQKYASPQGCRAQAYTKISDSASLGDTVLTNSELLLGLSL